jgi:hypothetical membrane protein
MLRAKNTMTERVPRILIVAALQYFLCEFLVAGSWRGNYSYRDNFISDLGVPYCGLHGTEPCSTSSVLMTLSFITFGAAFLVAAGWAHPALTPPVDAFFLTAAGIGAVVVGLVPSNANWPVHSLAASLFLIFGSCSALTIGFSSARISGTISGTTRWNKVSVLAAALGFAGLIGYFSYANSWYLGLGPGGIERVSAYSALLGFVCTMVLVNQDRQPRRDRLPNPVGTTP